MAYNIFNTIHRPLKLALLSTCINLGKKNRFNKNDAANSLLKVKEVLDVFKHQVEIESSVVLPLIFEYEPSVCQNYFREHDSQKDQLQKLESLLHEFDVLKNEVEKFRVMISIQEVFNQFLLNSYDHMDDEEEILNNILWQYYSDEFLVGMLQKEQIDGSSRKHLEQAMVFRSATAA